MLPSAAETCHEVSKVASRLFTRFGSTVLSPMAESIQHKVPVRGHAMRDTQLAGTTSMQLAMTATLGSFPSRGREWCCGQLGFRG